MLDPTPSVVDIFINDRQRSILAFIDTYKTDHGYPPSIARSAKPPGFPPPPTFNITCLIQKNGWIERDDGIFRAISASSVYPNPLPPTKEADHAHLA